MHEVLVFEAYVVLAISLLSLGVKGYAFVNSLLWSAESYTVVGRLTQPVSFGATSSSCCGLNPKITSFGCFPAAPNCVTVFIPSTGLPLGRITTASLRSVPALRQPSTIAPAILPQPTNQIGLRVRAYASP